MLSYLLFILVMFPKVAGGLYYHCKTRFLLGYREEKIEARAKNIKKIRNKKFSKMYE